MNSNSHSSPPKRDSAEAKEPSVRLSTTPSNKELRDDSKREMKGDAHHISETKTSATGAERKDELDDEEYTQLSKEMKESLRTEHKNHENDTLSRDHPLSAFLRQNKGQLKDLTEEQFKAKYDEFCSSQSASDKAPPTIKVADKPAVPVRSSSEEYFHQRFSNPKDLKFNDHLDRIVLKFTTLSDANTEAPSFTIDKHGAKIGREASNEVTIPSDTRLAPIGHSFIEYSHGCFYLVDGGYDFSASIRINVGVQRKEWPLVPDARFSVGNSVFRSMGVNANGNLVLDVVEGPLKGEKREITPKGATLGRSVDNVVSIPDRELSRRHSRVEFCEETKVYYICDIGSTNGTYVQLVGPYAGPYRLCVNDHILVGRTGFSINRFDYGLSEEIGTRKNMEDSCAIVQNLSMDFLNTPFFAPHSFFGVFDGHGGPHASLYLSQHVHTNIAAALSSRHDELISLSSKVNGDFGDSLNAVDDVIIAMLKSVFLETDKQFLAKSEYSQNGSTATTVLLLGNRLYCANVGDSRTLLCRNFAPKYLSEDHKPSREDEQKRIRDAGGFVINNRVMGELAVSRAFGDAEFKKGIQSIIDEEGVKMPDKDDTPKNWDQPLITAEPDVEVTTITADDQFLLLACDGLFDVFTEHEVVEFVRAQLEDHGDAQRCCQNLTNEAIEKRNSRDNVSVILIVLHKWY